MIARTEACEARYNLWCVLPFHRQRGPAHRLRDCFVPALRRLRNAWKDAKQRTVCVHVQKGVLQPLVQLLPARPTLRVVRDHPGLLRQKPARRMIEHYRRADVERYLMPTHLGDLHWYLATAFAGTDDTASSARLVIVRRAGGDAKGKLTTQGWAHLLASTSGYERAVYWGNESLRATLDLFRNANFIVGAHGAGVVNAVWCPGCAVVEIAPASPDVRDVARVETTARCFHNGSCHGGPWRSSSGHVLTLLNPQMRWSVAVLPLEQVCAANGLGAREVPSADEWTVLHRNYGPAHAWYRTHRVLPLSRTQAMRVAARLNDSSVPRGRLTFLGL